MRKNVRVNYPKRRHKLDLTKITGVSEPPRKTLYDTSLENFQAMNRATFLHRIIYAGEHFFPKSDDLIVDVFRAIIEQVNDDYNLEKLSGLFVYYSKHFVHMVEGDEDSINKHIRILLYGNTYTKYLGTIKLVVHVSHISRRLMNNWNSLFGTPAKLLGDLDINSSLEDSGRRIYSCIRKVYGLVTAFLDENYSFPTSDSDRSKPDYMSSDDSEVRLVRDSEITQKASLNRSSIIPTQCPSGLSCAMTMKYPYRPFLPEIELLDFILRSPFTMNLADYYSCYGAIPQTDRGKDKVWPIPTDNIPFDVFQKTYDTVTELPKPKVQVAEKKQEVTAAGKNDTEEMHRHVIFTQAASEQLVNEQNLEAGTSQQNEN